MTIRTKKTLRILLPIIYSLIVIVAVALCIYYVPCLQLYGSIAGALFTLQCVHILRHIDRQQNNITMELYRIGLLLAINSYFLPTLWLLQLFIFGYTFLYYPDRLRHFFASVLGWLTVAIYMIIGIYFGWLHNTWSEMFTSNMLIGWVPVGGALIAYFASHYTREKLRDR